MWLHVPKCKSCQLSRAYILIIDGMCISLLCTAYISNMLYQSSRLCFSAVCYLKLHAYAVHMCTQMNALVLCHSDLHCISAVCCVKQHVNAGGRFGASVWLHWQAGGAEGRGHPHCCPAQGPAGCQHPGRHPRHRSATIMYSILHSSVPGSISASWRVVISALRQADVMLKWQMSC